MTTRVKYRIWLLIIPLLMLGLTAALLAHGLVQRLQLQRSSETLVLDVTTQLSQSWRAGTLLPHAHDSLLRAMPQEALQRRFDILSRMGSLQGLTVERRELEAGALLQPGGEAEALYRLSAEYSEGSAEIQAVLVQQEGRWLFTEYIIFSPLLTQ